MSEQEIRQKAEEVILQQPKLDAALGHIGYHTEVINCMLEFAKWYASQNDGWVSVETKLPEVQGAYLCIKILSEGGISWIDVCFFKKEGGDAFEDNSFFFDGELVDPTFWKKISLPKAPTI
ncbi:MAG: hypothetical protein V4549_06550 [Bacteroidota bacterium]